MKSPGELNIATFAENRFLVAMTISMMYAFMLVLAYCACLFIFFSSGSPHSKQDAASGLLALLIIFLSVLITSLRVKLKVLSGACELVILNMWNSERIKCSEVVGFAAADYRVIKVLGPKMRVVFLEYLQKDGSTSKVPIVASYSGGKPTKLLAELEKIARSYPVACDLSRMIY